MAHISHDYLQLNDDGTPRRKHDIEEPRDRRPVLLSFTGLVFFQIIALIKQFWFEQEKNDGQTKRSAAGGSPEQVGTNGGPIEHAAILPPDESLAGAGAQDEDAVENGDTDPVHGSGLKYSVSIRDLNFFDSGPIETAKLGSPLAPPLNDNIRLYGSTPGTAIILPDAISGTGTRGPGGAIGSGPGNTNEEPNLGNGSGSEGGNPGSGSGGPGGNTGSGAPGGGNANSGGSGAGGNPNGGTSSNPGSGGGNNPGSDSAGGGNAGTGGSGAGGSSGSGGAGGSSGGNRLPSVSNVVLLSTLLINEARALEASDLLQHASDADGDTLQVTNVRASAGHVITTPSGGWLYIPEFNDRSVVEFTFEINDGAGTVIQKAYLPIAALPHVPLAGTEAADNLAVHPLDDAIGHIVEAGSGNDTVIVGSGDDVVYGGHGNDVIWTGAGNDVIFAGDGDDIVEAGDGDDIVQGEGGNDILRGAEGNDKIDGGTGEDQLYGGNGNDTLVGGADSDYIDGGAGNDLIISESGDADDTVTAGSGDDIYISAFSDGADQVAGNEGNDTFIAATADGNDIFEGGDGNDQFIAATEDGNDTVSGGKGNDTFISAVSDGVDHFEGLEGHDIFVAVGVGDGDVFDGGEGSDTYDASAIESAIIVDLTSGTVTLIQAGDDEQSIGAAAFTEPSEPATEQPPTATEDPLPITGDAPEPEVIATLFGSEPTFEPTSLISVENVIGGSGNDQFIANDAHNEFTGGEGEDLFVFQTVASAGNGSGSRDKILDFDVGDRIKIDDISEEFADEFNSTFDDPGIRKFVLISQAQDFSRPGEVRFKYDEETNTTILEGNVDYDADTEFELEILGVHDLKYDSYVYSS